MDTILRHRWFAALAAALFLLVIFWLFWFHGGHVTSRFRVDVNLSINGATGNGSGVWEASMDKVRSQSGPYSFHKTQVFGEAIEVPLSDGRVAMVLRRSMSGVSNIAAGALIVDCLDINENDLPTRLGAFSGGCFSDQRLMVIVLQDEDSERLERASYPPSSAEFVVTDFKLSVRVTTDELTSGIVDRHRWISTLPTITPRPGVYAVSADRLYREDFTTLSTEK